MFWLFCLLFHLYFPDQSSLWLLCMSLSWFVCWVCCNLWPLLVLVKALWRQTKYCVWNISCVTTVQSTANVLAWEQRNTQHNAIHTIYSFIVVVTHKSTPLRAPSLKRKTTDNEGNNSGMFVMYSPDNIYNLSSIVSLYILQIQ